MKHSTLNILVLAAAASLTTLPLQATSPEERGLEIAREADARDTGFSDFVADVKMILRNRHGQESTRDLRTQTLEVADDGDKTMIIFDSPSDVKGTAFLTFSHPEGDDDQWLYLPALKRVKRISSSNKSGPFVGSEFAYEDISSQEVEEYTYRFDREETVDGQKAFVVEFDPVHPKSGYSRLLVWIDTAEYRTLKIEFYDRKNEHFKTLTYEGYEKYVDRYWRPAKMKMVNHQNGKETEILWSGYQFRTGLDDRDFNQASLARAR